MSLAASRYAPKTPRENVAISKAQRLKEEKAKATRLLNRLQWKAECLVQSYIRAVEILRAESDYGGNTDISGIMRYAFIRATNSKHAESMFKVDFFEFYTLLERYISVSLAIMGVHVSGTVPRTNVNALKYITNPELRNSRPQALHAFHANLLQALDDKGCPLHTSLGTQEVRIQLGLAKDYRNAWKDADEENTRENGYTRDRSPSKNVALRDFDLDTMLRMILTGCEHAHVTVQARPETDSNSLTTEDFEQHAYYDQYNSMDMDDVPFEYIDDAMDLD